jgi:hypothetical protein
LFAWLAQRLLIQEPFVLQENVVAFSPEIFKDVLTMYWVDSTVLDAKHLGWPVNRRRRYTLLRHKLKTGAVASPMSLFTGLFAKPPPPQPAADSLPPAWDCLFVADLAELRSELLWAAGRPLSSWTGSTDPECLCPLDSEAFYQTLTATEQRFLRIYRERCPGQVYQLNQNPEVTMTASTTESLPTIVKNAGILWLSGLSCV